jgi:hypothetical protein
MTFPTNLTLRCFLRSETFRATDKFVFSDYASRHKTVWYILFYIKRDIRKVNNWLLKCLGTTRCYCGGPWGLATGCKVSGSRRLTKLRMWHLRVRRCLVMVPYPMKTVRLWRRSTLRVEKMYHQVDEHHSTVWDWRMEVRVDFLTFSLSRMASHSAKQACSSGEKASRSSSHS